MNVQVRVIRRTLSIGGVLWSLVGVASVQPASVFNHNMVLQRGCRVSVWGGADSGEEVCVAYGNERQTCRAGADGRWHISLSPMPASSMPQDLMIGSCVFTNVVVGEVWLCSGQSNMELQLWGKPQVKWYAGRETDGYFDAALVNMPNVRACTIPWEWDVVEHADFRERMDWRPFLPGTQRDLSAIAFHYAVILHAALGVPIGVVVAAWGGSSIAPWISPDGFRSVPPLAKFADSKLVRSLDGKNPTTNACAKGKMVFPSQCRILWNAMIRPLAPMAMRGVTWYQGESDRAKGLEYRNYLQALWNGWSKAFELPRMSFYLVQLAPFGTQSDSHCEIWSAQEEFANGNASVGMVSAVDVGELDNVHPCRKRTVAMRLAVMALNRDYGRKDLPCEGPRVASCRLEGGAVRVSFDNVRDWCRCGGEQPGEFELSGADGAFNPASVEYAKGSLRIFSKAVAAPKRVRYLWSWNRIGKLKNEYGLPVTPFCVNVEDGPEK